MKTRKEAVAGTFYPADKTQLLNEVKNYIDNAKIKSDDQSQNAIVAIMPHAGYVYSGSTAGAVAAAVNVPNRVIILCPQHTTQRYNRADANFKGAISKVDVWEYSFGNVPVDKELCNELIKTNKFEFNDFAHENEHSLEVEVPFIWHRNTKITITPIAFGFNTLPELEIMGNAIANVISKLSEPVLIIASTDMSHQLSAKQAEYFDKMAIKQILNLNPVELYKTVIENNISMCGVAPTTVALFAANNLGAKSTQLINYTNSSAVNGDVSSVVGYAGIVIK